MRLGLALPHYDTSLAGRPASWEGVRRVARGAEEVGLDSVWVSDHFFLDWSKYGGPPDLQGSLECWTTMAAIAAVTERVGVGSLVLCNDFRHPTLVAKMGATLDVLSGGRLTLALGAGWYEPEYHSAGIPFDPPAVRLERLAEAVEIVARLLSGEELTFSGRHYELRGALCRPLPAQRPRPPVWVGGKGDRLVTTAARRADGWNLSWLRDITTYRERAAFADAACERAGRDPSALRRSVGVCALAGRDDVDARRRFERMVERTPTGVLKRMFGGGGVSFQEFRGDHVAGTVSEVTDRLGELSALRVEEVVVTVGVVPFQLADEDDVSLFGEIARALR